MFVNGEDLSKPPRIKISTIHGAKGGEATNVVLYLNQTENTLKGSKRSKEKYDEEQRVWYVGITRTIDNLYLIKCKNKKYIHSLHYFLVGVLILGKVLLSLIFGFTLLIFFSKEY